MGYEYRVWFSADAQVDIFSQVGRGAVPSEVECRDDCYLVTSDDKWGIKFRDVNSSGGRRYLEIKRCHVSSVKGPQVWKKITQGTLPPTTGSWWQDGFTLETMQMFGAPTQGEALLIRKKRRQLESSGAKIEHTECTIWGQSSAPLGKFQTVAIE